MSERWSWVSGYRDRVTGESSWSKHEDFDEAVDALQDALDDALHDPELTREERGLIETFSDAAEKADDGMQMCFRIGDRRYFVQPPHVAAIETALDGLESEFEQVAVDTAIDYDPGWEL